jgi:hypothetical protein
LNGEELIERHDDLLLIVIGFMKKYHLEYMPDGRKMEVEGEDLMNYSKSLESRQAVYPGATNKATEHQRGTAARRDDPFTQAGGEMFMNRAARAMVLLPIFAVVGLIVWLGAPIIHGNRDEQWKALFADGERAREIGDRYRALEMYMHSARIASSVDDWRGELKIACGLQKLSKTEGPSLYGFNVIESAMESAARQKSAEGMHAVADAFTALGASFSSFALSRVRDDWPEGGANGGIADRRRSGAARTPPAGC